MRVIQPNIFLYFFLFILGLSGFFFSILWPQAVGLYAFILFAGMGGFGVTLYIYYTKKQGKQLVCPVGSDCNVVINGRYSKFFGISLEYWGMAYYLIILSSYATLIFVPSILPSLFLSGLMLLTTVAFFFSLYLLFVQAFLLRQWCIWCLLSALLSIIIFTISLANIDFIVTFLAQITNILVMLRALGFVLGMGGATTALFLFSRFLRDITISDGELYTLKEISELVWLGLAFVLVSQFSFFIVHIETLAHSSIFIIQTLALFIVAISGSILMIIFAPFLSMISFSEKAPSFPTLKLMRKPLFLTGAVALSSWYFAFIVDYIPIYGLSLILSVYGAIFILGVIIATFWEKRFGDNTL